MDREKVISALHCRAQDLMIDPPACDGCDYQFRMVNRMGCDFRRLCRDALALLKEQEVVVRCKDCKHGTPCNDGEYYCEKDIGTFESSVHCSDWFCADGEKEDPHGK